MSTLFFTSSLKIVSNSTRRSGRQAMMQLNKTRQVTWSARSTFETRSATVASRDFGKVRHICGEKP